MGSKGYKVGDLFVNLSMSVAQFEKDTNAAVKSIDKIEKTVAKLQKGFQNLAVVAGTAIGFKAIKGLVGELTDLAKAGDALGDLTASFQKLGGSSNALNAAKEAMFGTVRGTQLMAIANKGLLREIPNFNAQFANMAQYAYQFADATGGDAAQSLDQLTEALAKAKPKQLESLGIVINEQAAYKSYAEANGIATGKLKDYGAVLTDVQKREARQLEAQDQMIAKMKTLPQPVVDATAAHEAFTNALSGIQSKIGVVINESPELIKIWQDLTKTVNDIDWNGVGEGIAFVSSQLLGLLNGALPRLTEEFKNFATGLKVLKTMGTLASQGPAGSVADFMSENIPGGSVISNTMRLTTLGSKLEEAQKIVAEQEFATSRVNDLRDFNEKVADLRANIVKAAGKDQLEPIEKQIKALEEFKNKKGISTPNALTQLSYAKDYLDEIRDTLPDKAPHIGIHGNERGTEYDNARDEQAKKDKAAAEKAKKEIDSIQDKWDSFKSSEERKSIGDIIAASLKTGDWDAYFVNVEADIKKAQDEAQKQFQEGLDKKIISQTEFDKKMADMHDRMEDEAWTKKQEAEKKAQEEQLRTLKENYREAVDYWGSLMTTAINDAAKPLDEVLKDAALRFAPQLLATVQQGLGITTKALQQGTEAASQLLVSKITGDQKGIEAATKSLEEAGVGITQAAGNTMAFLQGMVATLGAALGMKSLNQSTHSEQGTGKMIGTGAGAIGGAIVGQALIPIPGLGAAIGAAVGAQLGGMLGQLTGSLFQWGTKNPETQARRDFAEAIEGAVHELRTIAFYGQSGKLQVSSGKNFNFLENRSAFKGDWGADYEKMGKRAQGVFSGLGDALKQTLGLTEDVGNQIAYLLGKQLSGNVDNARLLVLQLGYSFDQLSEAVLKAAQSGDIRWAEYNRDIAGLTDAFKPGLAAVGDYVGAMNELIDSGGRGQAALKGFRDIAVEGMEAGAKNIDDLKQKMLASGADPAQVKAIFDAAAGQGIKTLQDWANAEDKVAGAAVGNMETLNQAIADKWVAMGQDIDSINEKLRSLPEKVKSSVTVEANIDPNLLKLMDSGVLSGQSGGSSSPDIKTSSQPKMAALGGILTSPAFISAGAIAGEAGPEGIIPLKKLSNGALGVSFGGSLPSGGTVYNIDARGASPGVEARIMTALASVERRATSNAINAILESKARNRW